MSKEMAFVELAKKYEQMSEELQTVREQLTAAMTDLGVDKFAQDPTTGLVYKVVKPTGTFMYYRDIDYKRTAKEGERGGQPLSKKDAEAAGFVLNTKEK